MKSVFSVKPHWPKTKISGMVVLDVLMKAHYRTGLGNPVVVPEKDPNLAKIGK